MKHDEKFGIVLDEFIKATAVPSIALKAVRKDVDVRGSKLGGIPYMPKGFEYPHSKGGVPLKLLAQLNFSELPKLQHYPQKGILQFFVENDDLWGLDFDVPTRQNKFRVIYHKDVLGDDMLAAADSMPKIEVTDDNYFPFTGEYALESSMDSCHITCADYRFDGEFLKIYNKHFGTDVGEIWDLDESDTDRVYKASKAGSRIGGYPFFTQEDPRGYEENRHRYNTLLLQIDSEYNGDVDIMWGDAGVANFFINSEDLKSCNFSDILYNWDCS